MRTVDLAERSTAGAITVVRPTDILFLIASQENSEYLDTL